MPRCGAFASFGLVGPGYNGLDGRELSGIACVDRSKFLGGFYLLLLHIFLAVYGFQI
jgi:hypothetical protein